jgi:hypothetical protein
VKPTFPGASSPHGGKLDPFGPPGNDFSTLSADKIDPKGSIMDRDKLGQSVFTGLVVVGIVAMSAVLAAPRVPGVAWVCGTPLFASAYYRSRSSNTVLAETDWEKFRECLNPQPPAYCNAHPDPGLDPQTTREHWDRCLADGRYDDC